MDVGLGVIGGFITAEIAPQKHAAHNNDEDDN
jgi:hypothetical protein